MSFHILFLLIESQLLIHGAGSLYEKLLSSMEPGNQLSFL